MNAPWIASEISPQTTTIAVRLCAWAAGASMLLGGVGNATGAVPDPDGVENRPRVTAIGGEGRPALVAEDGSSALLVEQRLPTSGSLDAAEGFARVFFGEAEAVVHLLDQARVGYRTEKKLLRLDLERGALRVFGRERRKGPIEIKSGQASISLLGGSATITRDAEADRTVLVVAEGQAELSVGEGEPQKIGDGQWVTVIADGVRVSDGKPPAPKRRPADPSIGSAGGLTPVSIEQTALRDMGDGASGSSDRPGKGKGQGKGSDAQRGADVSTAASAAAAGGAALAGPALETEAPDAAPVSTGVMGTFAKGGASRGSVAKQNAGQADSSRMFLLGGSYSGGKETLVSLLPTQRGPGVKRMMLHMLRGVVGQKTAGSSRSILGRYNFRTSNQGTQARRLPRYFGPKG